MSEEGETPKETSKAPEEVIAATKALAAAIMKNGQCIINMNTIVARRSSGYDEHFEWKKSCDELAMAHAELSLAITLGGISDFADAVKDGFAKNKS